MIEAPLAAWCEHEECKWRRVAQFDTARALELAAYEHMRDNEMHLTALNFQPPKVRTVFG